jgi:hypothetical protein
MFQCSVFDFVQSRSFFFGYATQFRSIFARRTDPPPLFTGGSVPLSKIGNRNLEATEHPKPNG